VVPIIGAMMIVASRREIMGEFRASLWQRVLGWLTFAVMGTAAIAMFVLM
jgi:Mn2+/Fe2+ NRAMP family transporter